METPPTPTVTLEGSGQIIARLVMSFTKLNDPSWFVFRGNANGYTSDIEIVRDAIQYAFTCRVWIFFSMKDSLKWIAAHPIPARAALD